MNQGLAQPCQADIAGLHDPRGVSIVDERQQHVLQRRKFVTTCVGVGECGVYRGLNTR